MVGYGVTKSRKPAFGSVERAKCRDSSTQQLVRSTAQHATRERKRALDTRIMMILDVLLV